MKAFLKFYFLFEVSFPVNFPPMKISKIPHSPLFFSLSLSAIFLKRDSNTGVFLRIMRNF